MQMRRVVRKRVALPITRIGQQKVITTTTAITTTLTTMPTSRQKNRPWLPHPLNDHRGEADENLNGRNETENVRMTITIIGQEEIDGDMTDQEVVADAAEAVNDDLPETKDDIERKMETISKILPRCQTKNVENQPMLEATKRVRDEPGRESDKVVPVHQRREKRKTRCLPEGTEDMTSTIDPDEANENVVTNLLQRPRQIHRITATPQKKRSEVDASHLGNVVAEEVAAGEEVVAAAAVPGKKMPMAIVETITTIIAILMDEKMMVIKEHPPKVVITVLL